MRRERSPPGAERAIQQSVLRLSPQRKPPKAKEREGEACQNERRERPHRVASGVIQRPASQHLKVDKMTEELETRESNAPCGVRKVRPPRQSFRRAV